MCERCRRFTHFYCRDVIPTKKTLPEGPWFCDLCCPTEGPLPQELLTFGGQGTTDSDYKKWGDVWHDEETLQALKGDETASGRAKKRAKFYKFQGPHLLTAKEGRKVPPPSERLALLRELHKTTGHRGARSLCDMMRHQWYWSSMLPPCSGPAIQPCQTCVGAGAQREQTSFDEGGEVGLQHSAACSACSCLCCLCCRLDCFGGSFGFHL